MRQSIRGCQDCRSAGKRARVDPGEVSKANVLAYADHFEFGKLPAEVHIQLEPFSEWIFLRREAAGSSFADDRNTRPLFSFSMREITSAPQRSKTTAAVNA